MKHLLYPFLFILIVFVFFWRVFVQGLLPIPADSLVGLYHPFRDVYAKSYPSGIPFKNFLLTDPVLQQYPWRWLAVSEMREGRAPLWNPYTHAGSPLEGNLQSAPFYPLNILLFIAPFHAGWTALVILQPLLAGLFMFGYLGSLRLRNEARLLGGIVYAFCGFSMVWLEWNTVGHVALWLPAVLLIKEHILATLQGHSAIRKLLLLFAALVTVESSYWLAGHPQTAFYVWIVTNIYLFARCWQTVRVMPIDKKKRYLRRLLVFFSLATLTIGALVSVQAYEFLKFTLYSSRASDQAAWELNEGWFIPLNHLVQFLAPDFFGNPATLNYWGTWNYLELTGYIGVAPLIFALTAVMFRRDRKTLFFGILGLLGLLFALPTPLAKLPFQLSLPFIATSQPTRLLSVIDFSLAVLAALGMDAVIKKQILFKQAMKVIILLGIVYAGLWFYVMNGRNAAFSTMDDPGIIRDQFENFSTSMRNLILPTALYLSSSVLIVLLVRAIRVFREIRGFRVFAVSCLLLIVSFDLLRFGWKFTPFSRQEYLYPQSALLQYLQERDGKGEVFRIMSTDRRILPPNVSVMYGLQTVDGYDPLFLTDYAELMSAWVRNEADISPYQFNRIITPQNYDSRLADLLNVRFILSFDELSSEKLVPVFGEGKTILYENIQAFPRAYLAESVVRAEDKQQAIELLFDETVDLQKTAVVYDTIGIGEVPIEDDENAAILDYSSSRIRIQVNASADRLLVLSDSYYPSWRATIDGEDTKIYKTNYAFRGVVVPEGDHTVEFFL